MLPRQAILIREVIFHIFPISRFQHVTLLLAILGSMTLFTHQASAQHFGVSFQLFYDQLSPYGQWVDYPDYGYVWIPDAEPDFAPYATRGHWIFTSYGWTWVSDYRWGWAPFHYGRWFYDDYYGWLWVPDREWGPSWVSWRQSSGYYGWAPLGPGININISFGGHADREDDHWMFVRDRDMDRSDIHHYAVDRSEHARIYNNSTVINQTYIDKSRHTTYVSGPTSAEVQKATGRPVKNYTIRDNPTPGQALQKDQLQIYRPQVIPVSEDERKPAPTKVIPLKDVKAPAERNQTGAQQNVKQDPVPAQQTTATPSAAPRQQKQEPARQQNVKQNPAPAQQPKAPSSPSSAPQQHKQEPAKQQNVKQDPAPAQQQKAPSPASSAPQQHKQEPAKQQNSKQNQAPAQQPKAPAPSSNAPQQHKQEPAKQQNVKQNPAPAQPSTVSPSGDPAQQHGNPNTAPQSNNGSAQQQSNNGGKDKQHTK